MFEEIQVGSERYNILSECSEAESATILLRGGAPQFLDEAERSLHDAIMIVRRALKSHAVVGGGGAIEVKSLEYSSHSWLRQPVTLYLFLCLFTTERFFMSFPAPQCVCVRAPNCGCGLEYLFAALGPSDVCVGLCFATDGSIAVH